MGKKAVALLAAIILTRCIAAGAQSGGEKESLSFRDIGSGTDGDIGSFSTFTASDGIKLAYFPVETEGRPRAALIFIHGGGAYSEAGYQALALGLRDSYRISTYLLDLRGHGRSEGPRGDSPTEWQVAEDLQSFVAFVKAKNRTVPLLLGGHSSGGGLILNYDSWIADAGVDAYVFVSPEFGYKSQTSRMPEADDEGKADPSDAFVRVEIFPFILHGMTLGLLCGHTPVVFFNYPEEAMRARPLLLKYLTCNMSLATTPANPQIQFNKIHKPFFLCVGSKDELFDPQKVVNYFNRADESIRNRSCALVVEGETHLSILARAGSIIGENVARFIK